MSVPTPRTVRVRPYPKGRSWASTPRAGHATPTPPPPDHNRPTTNTDEHRPIGHHPMSPQMPPKTPAEVYFPSYRGQRKNPGLWWSSTISRHVGYGSWADRDEVTLLGYDPKDGLRRLRSERDG